MGTLKNNNQVRGMKKFNIEIADSKVLIKGIEAIIDFYSTLKSSCILLHVDCSR